MALKLCVNGTLLLVVCFGVAVFVYVVICRRCGVVFFVIGGVFCLSFIVEINGSQEYMST